MPKTAATFEHVIKKYLLEDMNCTLINGYCYAVKLVNTKNSDTYLVEKMLKKRENQRFLKWLRLFSDQNSRIDNSNIIIQFHNF